MGERLTKLCTAALKIWRTQMTNPPRYRSELHYMRGPGPKWRAKHAALTGQR